jgi:hypothetical protein
MTLTIGNIVLILVLFLCGLGLSIWAIADKYNGSVAVGIIILLITIILCLGLMFGLSWWHNNTANGIRAMKDYTSNMSNGINREITITAEDGREIFHYEGKIDVETSHANSENYILFESEEGLRYIIYYGVQDTVLIVEKPSK